MFLFKFYLFKFDFIYFMIVLMLVFVVGGFEKILLYVNKIKNLGCEFLLGMLVFVGMVVICVLLGLFVMGILFNFKYIFVDLMVNGVYYVF